MARRLLLGRAGTGKTHQCLALLTRTLERKGRALLLVPTYSQAEHLRYLLLDRSSGLSVHAVETFSSLAERITRVRLRELVPPAVRDRLAARALGPGFGDAAAQPGLRAEFLAAVKEIKEQGKKPDEVVEKARAHFAEGSRGRRLFDAYAGYRELLPGLDHEDLLIAARDRLRAEPLRLDLLLVDGFHDFTEVQREIVQLLAAGAEEAVVTLPLDPDDRANPIFATAARTADAFPGFAPEPLRGNRRAGGGLAEVERRLFSAPAPERVPAPGLELLVSPSEEDEADRLARLVAASGRPCDDFLLVRRSFDERHAVYRAAFRRHGVPLRFYTPESLNRTPAARAATLWLRLLAGRVVEPFEALPLLRSPYYLERPPAADVDEFAHRLGDPREAPDEVPEEWRPRRDAPLAALVRRSFGVRNALVSTPDGDDEIARAARFLELLAEEAEATEGMPLADAADLVARRLPLLRAAPRDRRHDCVYAVDAQDARQWEKPVVLVAGLTADAFPRQFRQDSFLRDEERKGFGEERDFHLPLRARREDEERYLFYVALTRAQERLVLSYPAYDEKGTERAPSPYLEETLAHFAGYPARRIELAEQYAQPRDAVCREDLLPIVADGLSHGSALAASLHDLRAVDPELLAWPRRLELARARPATMPSREVRLSASSINAFIRCPYLLMVRHYLRVERPREPGLDPLLRGEIAHAALEACGSRPEADAGAIFDEEFARRTAGVRVGLAGEAQRRWLRASVVRVAERLAPMPVEHLEHPFEVPVGDATLRGRIDRVEVHPAGRLIRDFKTGRPSLADVQAFEDIQLDAYLLALEDPAGAVFERLRNADCVGFVVPELRDAVPGRNVEEVTREQLAERQGRMRALVGNVAGAARAGRLAVKPRWPDLCTRGQCDGYDLCRVARARFLEKAGRNKWPS